jgi:Lysylphosphatidylglycerol synthase TM region
MSAPEEEESSGTPRWAKWVSRLVFLGAIVALGVTLYSVGFATIWNQLRIIGWWFVPIVLLEVASAFADAMVIHGFLGSGGRRPGYWSVLKAQVSGRAINLVTPMASLGEATKATMLMRDTSSRRAVAAVVRFNISYAALNLSAVVIGAPIVALALDLPSWMENTLWIGTGVSVAVIIGVGLLLRAGLLGSLLQALRSVRILSDERVKKLKQKIKEVDQSLRGDRGLRSWLPGLWALVSKILGWGIVWIVMNANGEPPGVGVIATLASAGTLVNLVSNIAPMGIGINEAGTAVLMAALGENAGLGVTTVLARRVIQICYAAVGLTLMATETVPIPHKSGGKKGTGSKGSGEDGKARSGNRKRGASASAAEKSKDDVIVEG